MNSRTPISRPSILRETGIAVAVLAIYVLTLLLPLHQSASLQRDLNALGFSTLESWSVCQSLAQDENGDPDQAAALTCPAAGIAKHQFAALLPTALVIAPPTPAGIFNSARSSTVVAWRLPDHFGQSRAPPVKA